MQQAQLAPGQQVAPGQQAMIGGQLYVVQQPQQPQPQQIIIVNNAMQSDTQLQTYNAKIAKICGAIQISMGILAIIFNMAAAIINYNSLWAISTGWWGSPFIITAGCLGVASAKYKTRTLINCTLGFSIVSCLLAIPFLVQCGLAISSWWYYGGDRAAYNAMNGLLIVVTLVELGVAICQSIICCNAACGCCQEIAMMQQQSLTQPNAQPGQQQYVYFNNAMAPNQQQMQMQQYTPHQQQQAMQQQQFMQQPMPQQQQFVQQQFMTEQYTPQAVMASGAPVAPTGGATGTLPPSYDNIENEKQPL